MYLSMLELNPRSRQVQAELRDPYQMHRTLSRAFGDDPDAYAQARCLFRVDEMKGSGKMLALLQSKAPPDWDRLPMRGYVASTPQVKEFTPTFINGQILRFRLRANPTSRRGRDGKRLGIYREDEQCVWLQRKAESGGFTVLSVNTNPDRELECMTADGFGTKFAVVTFDGVLRVNDPDLFLKTVESGIGTAKGFGFGLLSVAPERLGGGS